MHNREDFSDVSTHKTLKEGNKARERALQWHSWNIGQDLTSFFHLFPDKYKKVILKRLVQILQNRSLFYLTQHSQHVGTTSKIGEAFHGPKLRWQKMTWDKHSLDYLCEWRKNMEIQNKKRRENKVSVLNGHDIAQQLCCFYDLCLHLHQEFPSLTSREMASFACFMLSSTILTWSSDPVSHTYMPNYQQCYSEILIKVTNRIISQSYLEPFVFQASIFDKEALYVDPESYPF